jgi:SNF2 family DNA or RNA helicase
VLVLKDQKALLLKLNDPDRVTSVIPTARKGIVGGHTVVAVPYRLDEVRVLRNLGFNAPAPIEHYYEWSGRYTPYNHQKATAGFLTVHNKALVLNQIGTGKSNSALWAADYLMQQGAIKKVLIISPLSTLERVWGDAIFLDFPHRKAVTLYGTAERRERLLKTDCDFYIVNHDGFSIIADQCKGMFDLVIVDEAAVLRNHDTRRYKIMRKFMKDNPLSRLWLMTGTPTPNAPTDAWTLAKLVESPLCADTYTAFKDRVMMRIGKWKYLPRPNSAEIVKDILQPSVCYTREECFDLPDTVLQTRKVQMTDEQTKAYKTMMKKLVVEFTAERLQHGTISAANEAVKMQKLIQICCGCAYDDQGNAVELDASPRIQAVREIIEEAGEKVIIFVPLTGALHMLERELSKDFTVAFVNGEVSSSKRDVIFNDFQNLPDPRVLIAHPATMAHGLTLTAASTSGSHRSYRYRNTCLQKTREQAVASRTAIGIDQRGHA